MNRRRFLAAGASAAAAAGMTPAWAAQNNHREPSPGEGRQYYELRRYHLQTGGQAKLAADYFEQALIPALNRAGIAPVGVFTTYIGDSAGSPSAWVLMPAPNANRLVELPLRLEADEEYQKAATAFLNAPAREPGFVRWESSLLRALTAMPSLAAPPQRASGLFELRTYESTTEQDHRRKIEMMNAGEVDIFHRAGFRPLFMGDTVIGPRQPCLTYMIGFPALADRDRDWDAFRADAKWKQLTADPRYAFEPLVSNIDNAILQPARYSQI